MVNEPGGKQRIVKMLVLTERYVDHTRRGRRDERNVLFVSRRNVRARRRG